MAGIGTDDSDRSASKPASDEQAGDLPDFVVDEVEDYLRCGLLEHGVVRRCGHSPVVGFSCKRRGFCPSCTGRRTGSKNTAMGFVRLLYAVDFVFPPALAFFAAVLIGKMLRYLGMTQGGWRALLLLAFVFVALLLAGLAMVTLLFRTGAERLASRRSRGGA